MMERARDLAARHGVTEHTARRWLRAGLLVEGFRPPRGGRRPYKLTDAQVAEIREIGDLTLAEIAQQYGVSESYVSRLRRGLRRAG